jgi:MSHA biogenesis protein MshK
MAAHLSRTLLALVLLAALPAHAQGLNDPTRPPREILGDTGEVSDAAAGGSPAQVVVISSDRRQATINGRTVSLGGRYGDATLVRISDEEIVLQKADSMEIIRLYSSVNRKMRLSPDRSPTNAAERRED